MNTTTQRPTPETDDAARKGAYLTHGKYPETCGKQIVHIDFARKLERERDEVREELEAMRGAIREAHEAFKNVMELQPDVPPWANTEAMLALAKLQPFLKTKGIIP